MSGMRAGPANGRAHVLTTSDVALRRHDRLFGAWYPYQALIVSMPLESRAGVAGSGHLVLWVPSGTLAIDNVYYYGIYRMQRMTSTV
jgi:hypothetical protein